MLPKYLTETGSVVKKNSIVEIGVGTEVKSGRSGGKIYSLKVLGTEVCRPLDGLEACLFFTNNLTDPIWDGFSNVFDPCDGGTDKGGSIAQLVYEDQQTFHVVTKPLVGWPNGEEFPKGLEIQTIARVGPLPECPVNEVIQLTYVIVNRGDKAITPMYDVPDEDLNHTCVPFLPAAYFKYDLLPELWKLNNDYSWEKKIPPDNGGWFYSPAGYRGMAMGYFKPNDGWGVTLWGSKASIQTTTTFNFEAQAFKYDAPDTLQNDASVNVSLIDPIEKLEPGEFRVSTQYLVVGNRDTTKAIIQHLSGFYSASK